MCGALNKEEEEENTQDEYNDDDYDYDYDYDNDDYNDEEKVKNKHHTLNVGRRSDEKFGLFFMPTVRCFRVNNRFNSFQFNYGSIVALTHFAY